ncbi:MAG: hypothetical protein KDA20_05705 [Phycisphaerales bacterium]|nr:hypothetical protein [Phycisphaerales bacterium]
MSQKTQGGAVAPFLIGLGVCGAVWAAAATSCAGPRSGPLTRGLNQAGPPSVELDKNADPLDATTATASQTASLPELDPQVASRLNLLQSAMEDSTVGLGNATNAAPPAAPIEQTIDWSTPPAPLPQDTVAAMPEPTPLMTMGDQHATTEVTPMATSSLAQEQPEDPANRVRSLTHDLADATTDLAREEGSAVQALMRLSVLEMMLPGVSNAAFDDGFIAAAVAPDELKLLQTWRDVMRSMGTTDSGSSDTGSLIQAADELFAASDHWRDLTIQSPTLCTRVDGFGVYEPLSMRDGRYTFVAGRTNRVIVYLELDHFHTTATRMDTRDGFAVELSQSLALYHAGTPKVDADRDLVAWQRPSVQIDDFSRRARRDFFVVQMIELPSTISVGSYRLKVRVTDRATGAEAESVLDLDFVADDALASSNARR